MLTSWDHTYMAVAKLIAQHSKANRKKVATILVKDQSIISYGYNGTIPGFDNSCEDENGETKKEVIHSEVNAIAKCAKSGISTSGATAYLTFSPCINCALLLIQSGISRMVYLDQHSDATGIELMISKGIICEHLK